MARVGEQADLLRALGRLLDDATARDIQIKAHETFLGVSWETITPGTRHRVYQDHDLESLRRQAREMRQDTTGVPPGSFAELLRTLGQELDDEGIEATSIAQERELFRVIGMIGRTYCNRSYLMSELDVRSGERRMERGIPRKPPPPADPFTLVIPGLRVCSWDEQRLGKVGEIRCRHFRVVTRPLQRDFWLAADCVATVAPGKQVRLAYTKTHLEEHKSFDLPT